MNPIPYQILSSGAHMPCLGLGTWQLQGEAAARTVELALKLGYRHIDTARMYGNEAAIGDGIRRSGVPRQDIFVTTKLMPVNGKEAESAIQERMRLLGTEYLDLLLIHWPPQEGVAADMWQIMEAEHRAGVLRSIGVSNYSPQQLIQLIKQTKVTPAVNQIELSPFNPQITTRNFCEQHDILVEAYTPLTRQQQLDHYLITDLADKYERSAAQIMLRWCIQKQTVPLPKASSREHLEENLQIFDFTITDEDMAKLDAVARSPSLLQQ